jgi:hypothetical protein
VESKLLYLLTKETVVGSSFARLYITSPQLIVTGDEAWLTVEWDTTGFEINGMVASPAGIVVPVQGYYLAQTCVTFSSTDSDDYVGPEFGALAFATIVNNTTNIETARGTVISQSSEDNGLYTSVAEDLVYASQDDQLTVNVYASTPTTSIYAWSDDDDYFSSYFSLVYVCS